MEVKRYCQTIASYCEKDWEQRRFKLKAFAARMASDINVSAMSLSQTDGHIRGVTDGRMHGGGIFQVSVVHEPPNRLLISICP